MRGSWERLEHIHISGSPPGVFRNYSRRDVLSTMGKRVFTKTELKFPDQQNLKVGDIVLITDN